MSAGDRRDRSGGATVSTHVGNAIYGLGVIGAWVWFWQQEDGFWGHVWAIIEGIFWPAFMVYAGFDALG